MSFEGLPPHLIRFALGLLIGCLLGFVARWGRFCTLGALEDAIYARDTRRLRAWALAIAVAMLGVYLLQLCGLGLGASLYASNRLELGPLVIGGLMFGVGMALAGTCGFGTLLRVGGGDLKALVTVLILALSAMMAMRGLTALVRVAIIDPLAVDLPAGRSELIPALLGLDPAASLVLAGAVATIVAFLSLSAFTFRNDRRLVLTGIAIGLCVVAGWWATGIAGFDPFGTEYPVSFSFARPVGDTLLYGMLASGLRLDFAIGSVVGVIAGAFLEAWRSYQDALRRTREGMRIG